MPYRIHYAGDLCQQKISQIIDGLEGVPNSKDDIIIWGACPEGLETRTMEVFQSIKKYGLKLNCRKCQFNIKEIIFLGHKVTATSIHPDDKKFQANKNMP